MKPNLDKLENLSDAQLGKISADIDAIGIRKAAEQASKETDRSIDKTCIQRLKDRRIAQRFLVESPDATQATAEILRFAVTGRPNFSEATVKVLEETAFKLSLVSGASQEDELKALNQITVMLARCRNAAVRERMAKIQEDKLQLRREELEWKKSLQTSSVSASAHSVSSVSPRLKSPNSPLTPPSSVVNLPPRPPVHTFTPPCTRLCTRLSTRQNPRFSGLFTLFTRIFFTGFCRPFVPIEPHLKGPNDKTGNLCHAESSPDDFSSLCHSRVLPGFAARQSCRWQGGGADGHSEVLL